MQERCEFRRCEVRLLLISITSYLSFMMVYLRWLLYDSIVRIIPRSTVRETEVCVIRARAVARRGVNSIVAAWQPSSQDCEAIYID